MFAKTPEQRVFSHFCTYPTTAFSFRELSRKLQLSLPTILAATESLIEKDMLRVETRRPVARIFANIDNRTFIRYKQLQNIEDIYANGLCEQLAQTYPAADAIVLFGSYSRGEDTERSDIDIAIVGSSEREIAFPEYEEQLKRNIQLVSVREKNGLLYENVKNGFILSGAL